MDLLGSILSSMDKPPTASEREKKAAREMREKMEKEQEMEQKKRDVFRKKMEVKVGAFLSGTEKSIKFDPMDKIHRALVHEVATTAGLVTYSFGNEDDSTRHVVGYKKEYAPTEEELIALRRGEQQLQVEGAEPVAVEKHVKIVGPVKVPQHDYRDKYKHLIATQVAEPSAIKTEPERKFGFVPSANKRDQRSIEETLQDIRSKKRLKLTEELDVQAKPNNR